MLFHILRRPPVVALCGLPGVGKFTLLNCLLLRAANGTIDPDIRAKGSVISDTKSKKSMTRCSLQFDWDESGHSWELALNWNVFRVALMTSRSLLLPDGSRWDVILQRCCAVIYVVGLENDAKREAQRTYYERFIEIARHHNKLWNSVPWIVALNMCDSGNVNPLTNILPSELEQNAIRLSAKTGDGVDVLWDNIQQMVM